MQTLGARSKDLDIFVGEPQMLPNFFEAGFAADLSELDAQVAEKLVGYTYEAGKDVDGTLRAISYQACPGSVIYRRDRVYPQFCVNFKSWCKTKVDRGGGQGTLFVALTAVNQKSCSQSRAAAQPLFIYP